jgi:hypothetical protein
MVSGDIGLDPACPCWRLAERRQLWGAPLAGPSDPRIAHAIAVRERSAERSDREERVYTHYAYVREAQLVMPKKVN